MCRVKGGSVFLTSLWLYCALLSLRALGHQLDCWHWFWRSQDSSPSSYTLIFLLSSDNTAHRHPPTSLPLKRHPPTSLPLKCPGFITRRHLKGESFKGGMPLAHLKLSNGSSCQGKFQLVWEYSACYWRHWSAPPEDLDLDPSWTTYRDILSQEYTGSAQLDPSVCYQDGRSNRYGQAYAYLLALGFPLVQGGRPCCPCHTRPWNPSSSTRRLGIQTDLVNLVASYSVPSPYSFGSLDFLGLVKEGSEDPAKFATDLVLESPQPSEVQPLKTGLPPRVGGKAMPVS